MAVNKVPSLYITAAEIERNTQCDGCFVLAVVSSWKKNTVVTKTQERGLKVSPRQSTNNFCTNG